MLRLLSNILSAPAIAAAVTIIFSLSSPDIFLSLTLGFLFLVFFPVLPFFYFLERKIIDFDASDRRKRTTILLAASANYAAASAVFYWLDYHAMFSISAAYFFVTSAVLIINLFWKISIHAAGAAGPTTALVYVFGTGLLPLYILTAVVAYARFRLKAHTIPQLAAGAIIAAVVTFLVYFFLY